jgi:putative membrane protein
MKKFFIWGGLAMMGFLTACDKNDDKNNNTTVNSTDQMFMTNVAMGNSAEIMAGQLAASKSTNTSVKNFGQLMVTEHTQAKTDLQTVANGIGMTLSDSVDAEHRALMTRLNSLSGRSFDTAYMNSQVMDHQKTLTIFQTENSSGNNQSVRNYSNTYTPHIQMHLRMADSLSRTL